jgi:hypothetical protein
VWRTAQRLDVLAFELGDGGDNVPGESGAAWNRQPGADCRAQTDGLAAENGFV